MKKKWTLFLVVAGLFVVITLGTGGYFAVAHFTNGESPYRQAPVERGHVVMTISATGTLQPEEVIDIGAQVQGMIKEFGTDPRDPKKRIDYRSVVDKGTVLAKIDESLYAATVQKAEADLGQAEANVDLAGANLKAMQAKLEQTERDWQRVQKLRDTRALSDFETDTAQNLYETASAAIPGGEAAVNQAEKAVDTARAILDQAKINLGYCTIKATVKGEVLDRRVNVGQTVVASLNAPSLFLLAKDLKRMEVWVSVNEADIGRIQVGQKVSFAVDAFPGNTFTGEVVQIRFNASNTQNVVTYTVVVSTDNSSGKLLPYLTANVQFKIAESDGNPLVVPAAALRWKPKSLAQVAPDDRDAYVEVFKNRKREADARKGDKPEQESGKGERGIVWVADGKYVRPVRVRTGLTDGTNTEILEVRRGTLEENTPVITGEQTPKDAASSKNPFAPQMFRGGKQQEKQ